MGTRSRTARSRAGRFTGKTAENTGASTEAEAGSSTEASTGETSADTGAEASASAGAPAAVGTVAVEVDRPALLAEADAIAAGAPAPEAVPGEAPAGELVPPLPASERAAMAAPALRGFVSTAAGIIAPNWNVTAQECAALGDSLAEVLAHWMPDTDIPPKYLALFTFGMALTGVALQRRDPETGEFRPLRAPPRKREPAPAAAAPVAQAPGPAPLRL